MGDHSTHEFQLEVVQTLARLEEGNKAIVQRLDTLNGSVARHERRLNEIDAIIAKEQGRSQESARWQKRLAPLGWAILIFLGGVAASHPEVLRKALGQ